MKGTRGRGTKEREREKKSKCAADVMIHSESGVMKTNRFFENKAKDSVLCENRLIMSICLLQ